MRYIRMEIVGYIPLLFNSVKRFVYTPQSNQQIIIGTNGSGKSALLRELSPMPSVSSDYIKGGYCEKEIEKDGVRYTLKSDFKNGTGRHTFIRDGEILNDNGTGQIQSVLVKQYFGFDNDIHALMTDTLKFTDMGLQQRRDWITRISGADFNYAIGVWNKLRTELRDAVGALKHVNARLTELSEEGKDVGAIVTQLEEKIEGVSNEISVLIQNKPKNTESAEQVLESFSALAKDIESHKAYIVEKVLARVEAFKRLYGPATQDVLETLIQEEDASLKQQQHVLEARKKDYERIAAIVEKVEENGGGVGDLESKIKELEVRISGLSSQIVRWEIKDNPLGAKDQTQQILQGLRRCLTGLPANNGEYGMAVLNGLMEKQKEDETNLDKWTHALTRIEHRISHIKDANEEECPKCSERFVPGVKEGELEELETKARKGRALIDKTKHAMKERLDDIETQKEYLDQIRWLKSIITDTPRLSPLWTFLLEDNKLYKMPSAQLEPINIWIKDLDTSVALSDVRRKLSDYKEALDKLNAMGVSVEGYEGLAHSLQNDISEGIDAVEKSQETLRRLSAGKAFRESIDKEINAVQDLENEIISYGEKLLQAFKTKHIEETLTHHYAWVARLQDEIQKMKSEAKVLEELSESKTKLSEEVELLSILAENLSPKEGLIAEMITGFINELTHQINEVINAIWTYDLSVLPCGTEKGELDYKFPLSVRNNERPVKDIGLGSSGQQDVINFAFKLVAINYLGMNDYPLSLDELAPKMDEKHRFNIMQYVSKLVSAGRCSQLFMVSHYQSAHGSFVNAEYCVMDTSNVTLPDTYNDHVEFA